MNEKVKRDTIVRLYGIGAVLYLVLAVLAVKSMLPSTFQLTINYWTTNPLLSQTQTVFVTATRVLWSIQFRWVLVLLMGLSVLAPAYYIYMISNNVKKINFHKYRSVDWIVTGSLMLFVISVLAGVQDIMVLILIIGLFILSYLIILTAINHSDVSKPIKDNIYRLGVLSGLLPWLLILVYTISTWVYGSIRSPWFVYTLFIIGLINSAVIIYGYFWHKEDTKQKTLISHETYPILINQSIKILFVLILIIGLKR